MPPWLAFLCGSDQIQVILLAWKACNLPNEPSPKPKRTILKMLQWALWESHFIDRTWKRQTMAVRKENNCFQNVGAEELRNRFQLDL